MPCVGLVIAGSPQRPSLVPAPRDGVYFLGNNLNKEGIRSNITHGYLPVLHNGGSHREDWRAGGGRRRRTWVVLASRVLDSRSKLTAWKAYIRLFP